MLTYHATGPGDNVVDDNVALLLKALQLGATNAQLLSERAEEGLHDGDANVGEGDDPEADEVQVFPTIGEASSVPGLTLDRELVLDRVCQLDHVRAYVIAEEGSN